MKIKHLNLQHGILKNYREELKAIDIDIGLYKFPELDDVELNVSDDDFLKDTEIVREHHKRQQRGPKCVRCLNHESIFMSTGSGMSKELRDKTVKICRPRYILETFFNGEKIMS